MTIKEKIYCFKQLFKLELDIMYLIDNEFRCFMKAIKYFGWLSISYLLLRIMCELMIYL